MKTRITIMDAAALQINTIKFEEYADEVQLEKTVYQIGVYKHMQLIDTKIVRGKQEQKEYINELKRKHGFDALIFILDKTPVEGKVNKISINIKDKLDIPKLEEWRQLLFTDFDPTAILTIEYVESRKGEFTLMSIKRED